MKTIPSRNEELILRILMKKADSLFPLQLVQQSNDRLGRGTIYVSLQRLEQKGFVDSVLADRVAGQSGRLRRKYSINASGVGIINQLDQPLEDLFMGVAPA